MEKIEKTVFPQFLLNAIIKATSSVEKVPGTKEIKLEVISFRVSFDD